MKWSVAESVPDRASVHTRNAAFEAFSAPEQYCSAPLLKVERSVSDRFLKRSESRKRSRGSAMRGIYGNCEMQLSFQKGEASAMIQVC